MKNDNNVFLQTLGKAIMIILYAKKRTQSDLVRDTALSKSYISEILNGKKVPDLNTLNLICNSLEISLVYLFEKELEIRNGKWENHKVKNLDPISSSVANLDELIYPENYDNHSNRSRKPINSGKQLLES